MATPRRRRRPQPARPGRAAPRAASTYQGIGRRELTARVVVTGGAGFLGSHLCERCSRRGDEVVAVDNLVTGRACQHRAPRSGSRGFTFVAARRHRATSAVAGPGRRRAALRQPGVARSTTSTIPIQILKVGSLGTHNALGLAQAKGARFFLASTSEVYGDPQVHPQPETYWGNVNPIGPRASTTRPSASPRR